MQKTITNQIYIDKTPEQVMDFLLRPENWLKFASGLVDAEPKGEILKKGTVGSWTRKQGPKLTINNFKVIEMDYGKKLVMQISADGMTAIDQSVFEPAANGTKATFTETLTAHTFFAKLFLTLFLGLINKSLRADYINLKKIVELT